MISFIYFILVIVIALLLARYNESNKLFWTLLVSLMAGMAGWTLYQKLTTSDKIKQNNLTQIYSNGVPTNITNNVIHYFDVNSTKAENIVPAPYYKEIESEYNSKIVDCPSQCYITINYPPPEKILYTKTYFDTG